MTSMILGNLKDAFAGVMALIGHEGTASLLMQDNGPTPGPTIEPLVMIDGEKWIIKPARFYETSVLKGDRVRVVSGLEQIVLIRMRFRRTTPRDFTPTLQEVVAQIPEMYSDARFFEVMPKVPWVEADGQYHSQVVALYR